jgi:phosphoglycerol transferase
MRFVVVSLSAALVAFPGLFCLFLILRAFFDGNLSDMRYAFGVLVMFGFSLMVPVHGKGAPWYSRMPSLIPLILSALLLFPFTVVVLIFGQVDSAAFVFHLIFGIDGTPWGDFIPYIFTATVYWLIIFATVFRLLPLLPRTPLLPMIPTVGFVAINPLFNDILWNRADAAFGPNRTLLPEFREAVLRETDARPDLVIIYLEGFDRGYMDPDLFGDIAKPLRDLEKEATAFIQLHQIEATGWSLAGTIASQCGAPTLPFGAKPLGDTSEIALIMPEIRCLPDILNDRGYDVTYMSGAKIIGNKMGFYGFDNYLSTHGGATIMDRDTIPIERTAGYRPEDWGDWGIFDSELFEGARKRFLDLKQRQDPFALFIATMDTHGPMVGISPSCTLDGLPRMTDEMTRAVACVSAETVRFVRDIQAASGDRDLRIAVFSDHLSHGSNVVQTLQRKPRFNTAMLLGAEAAPRVIEKPGGTIDLYPTLLHWLGLLDPAKPYAGIGTSLLSDAPTLVERRSLDEVNSILKVDVEMAQFLWKGSD